MYKVGIDIGGTKIHGILMRGSRIVERVHLLHEKKTREGTLEILVGIIEMFQHVARREAIVSIGLGVPSPLNAAGDTVLAPPNFPALKGLKIGKWLERRTGIPVKLENDGRCFVLGAAVAGITRRRRLSMKAIVGLTIGTGIGGGISAKAGLWKGAHGSAGEMGHTVIVSGGERCSCGQRGCLEMYASGKFLVRAGGKSPKELEDLANAGNKAAKLVYEEMGRYLGLGIAGIVNVVDPDMIVIGGGVAKAQNLFLPSLRAAAARHILSPDAKDLPIVPASNIDDAGAVGACMLFKS